MSVLLTLGDATSPLCHPQPRDSAGQGPARPSPIGASPQGESTVLCLGTGEPGGCHLLHPLEMPIHPLHLQTCQGSVYQL